MNAQILKGASSPLGKCCILLALVICKAVRVAKGFQISSSPTTLSAA